jgi:DNA-binding response OmpR family regulator
MRWRPGRPSAPSAPSDRREVEPIAASGTLSVGPVDLDLHGRRVLIDGWCVHLPAREATLLMVLMRNAGRVLTTAELAQATNSDSTEPAPAVRRTRRFMRRLRRRLTVHPLTPVLIERVGADGFRFTFIHETQ